LIVIEKSIFPVLQQNIHKVNKESINRVPRGRSKIFVEKRRQGSANVTHSEGGRGSPIYS
jgi:hypothetical protein